MLKKSLSQHLIKDRNVLKRMVRLAGISKDDHVLEIGPGHGDLTRCIAEEAGFVHAVELDRSLQKYLAPLEDEFGNVRIMFGDFLRTDIDRLTEDAGKRLTVMGNIPYKITGPIIFKILAERQRICSAHLTVQKEIGQRIVALPGTKEYGGLSVDCQMFADVRVQFFLKPGIFIPPPKVESAFVSMILRDDRRQVDDGFIEFVRSCFHGRRKYLKNALQHNYADVTIHALYDHMGFAVDTRAEQIPPELFLEMYYFLYRSN